MITADDMKSSKEIHEKLFKTFFLSEIVSQANYFIFLACIYIVTTKLLTESV